MSGEGIVSLSVHHTAKLCVCVCVRSINLDGKGNALYPVLSSFIIYLPVNIIGIIIITILWTQKVGPKMLL